MSFSPKKPMGFTPKILFDEITNLKHKKDLRESQTYQIRDSIKKLQDELKKKIMKLKEKKRMR